MIRSTARRVLTHLGVVALAAVLVLALVALLGVALDSWRITSIGLLLILLTMAVVLADLHRQSRRLLRRSARGSREVVAAAAPAESRAPATASGQDALGLARLIQAQLVGRLDHTQTCLEEAIAHLRVQGERHSSSDGLLPPGSSVVVHRVDDHAAAIVRQALAAGHPVVVEVDNIATARRTLTEHGLGDQVEYRHPGGVGPAASVSLAP